VLETAVCLGDLLEGDPLGDARPDGIGAPPAIVVDSTTNC
jgi:hypothetical protein